MDLENLSDQEKAYIRIMLSQAAEYKKMMQCETWGSLMIFNRVISGLVWEEELRQYKHNKKLSRASWLKKNLGININVRPYQPLWWQ